MSASPRVWAVRVWLWEDGKEKFAGLAGVFIEKERARALLDEQWARREELGICRIEARECALASLQASKLRDQA